jgi:hypothetical protein
MPKLCEFENCRGQASYGEYYGKPIRCKNHKEEYKLVSRLCQHPGCQKQPNYNYPGETTALFCSSHKLENMVDIKHKRCNHDGCQKIPIYNYLGESKARFCSSHKLENMVDIKHKRCEHDGCQKIPIYNYEGESNARFCYYHKFENMIDIKHKRCNHDGCQKIPIYNYEGESNARFCYYHKFENMIDVKNKTCEHDECQKQPFFNYEGESKARFCSSHKEIGMIDVKSNRCEHEDCNKHPVFNYEGESKARFCSSHKFENMVNIISKRCDRDGCQKQPNYNYAGERTARFCVSHKEFGMIDIKNKRCKSSDICLGTFANVKYKGYCASCYQRLFPNDPLTYQIRSKTKEIAVRDYINSNFDDFHHDRPLWTGNCDCTHRRRIDHRKLIGNTLLCIETDENQHGSYDKTDEEIRYDDLMMLHGGKFVYIRFNPDKYKDKNGKSINPMLYTRLPVLHKEIEKQINRIENEENIELLEIIKLYYNE